MTTLHLYYHTNSLILIKNTSLEKRKILQKICFGFITFFAWQYSFSITFPSTHGRLDVPDAKQQKQIHLFNKYSLNSTVDHK